VGAWLLVTAVAVAGLFAFADRRSPAPVLPFHVLGRSEVWRGTAGAFLTTATSTSVATLITLYIQNTLGRSPTASAVALLPISVFAIVGSGAAARSIVRWPRERVAAAGLTMIGAGIGLPLIAPADVRVIGAGMGLVGLGIGLASVATTSMGTDVPAPARATASGIVNSSPQLGAAIGTALLLLIVATTTGMPDATTAMPKLALASAAGVAFIGAAAFARLPPNPAAAGTVRNGQPTQHRGRDGLHGFDE
jgi:predicted MFS family arabinose efflux permease